MAGKFEDKVNVDEVRIQLETEAQRNKELERLNTQLKAQKQMLYKIIQELYEKEKENLLKSEELVAQKEEIELQNQKLLEYAFYNAHKVRGPLARILGLVYLLKREADNIGFVDKDRYLEKLSESATELDIAVREMSHFLDE
jgi:light-regulated signal transduction histidine kinase (bacteriophytochrome)